MTSEKARQILRDSDYETSFTSDYPPETPFTVGDVVQLNSGGPHMTVVGNYALYVKASYFDEAGRLFDGNFPPDALRKVAKPPEPETEDTSYADLALADLVKS